MIEDRLRKFGLTANETRVYMSLLRFGRQTARELAPRAQVSQGRVYQVLQDMTRKGLATEVHGSTRTFTAVAPSIALGDILEERRNQLQKSETLLEELRGPLDALAAPRLPDLPAIEVLGRPEQITQHFQRLQDEAQKEILVFNRPPYIRRDNPGELRALARGVRHMGLYESGSFDDPTWVSSIRSWLNHGEEARALDHVPMKAAIFDRERGLMPLASSHDASQPFTAVLVHDKGLVSTLALAFDHLWERAEPLELLLGTHEPEVAPSP